VVGPWVTFTIENLGLGTLTISSVTLDGDSLDFDYTSPVSTSIAASGTTTFTIRFDPTQSAGSTGFFRINSNDPDTPQYVITLYGN
jgi:hypothetical protein